MILLKEGPLGGGLVLALRSHGGDFGSGREGAVMMENGREKVPTRTGEGLSYLVPAYAQVVSWGHNSLRTDSLRYT